MITSACPIWRKHRRRAIVRGVSILFVSAMAGAVPALAQTATPPSPASPTPTPPPAGKSDIVVTGQRSTDTTLIDRRTYQVSRDLQGANGSIADVLRNIPSVDVDLQGNVSLRGDSNVSILVDGKPTGLFRGPGGGQTLQQIPASQYERVEVMTNPSAAFGANGSGGIINLISRRNRAPGITGSVRGAYGTSGRRSTGGSISDKVGKLSLSADGSFRRDPQYSRDENRFVELDAAGAPLLTSDEVTRGAGDLHLWTARIGVDYDVDPQSRVSADFHHTTFDYHANMTSNLVGTDSTGAVARLFDRSGLLVSNRFDSEGSLSYRRDLGGQNHSFTASLTHERTLEDNRQRFDDSTVLPVAFEQFDNVTGRNTLQRTELKLDYTGPLPGKATLQAGYDLEADDDTFDDRGGLGPDAASAAIPDPAFTDLFQYTRTIAAAYAVYQRPFGDLAVQAGLRVEIANSDLAQANGGFFRRDSDTRWFPSLHLAYTLGGNDTIRTSFSERIQRPAPADLDPFRRFVDTFHFQTGNPQLKPQETQSFEVGFEHSKGATLDLATLYYRYNSNGVTNVATDLGNGVLLDTRENLADSRSVGMELTTNGRIAKKLTYRLSGNIYQLRIDASNLGLGRRSAWIESGKASLEWQPDTRDLVQASFSLVGKKLLPQGETAAMPLLNLGYRHKIDRRFWVFATMQDALHSYQEHDFVQTPRLIQHTDASARTRAAFLGITYNFGGKAGKDPGFDFSG